MIVRAVSTSKLKRLLQFSHSKYTYTEPPVSTTSLPSSIFEPQTKPLPQNPTKTLASQLFLRSFSSQQPKQPKPTTLHLNRDGNYDESTSKTLPICPGCGVPMQDTDTKQPGFFIKPSPKNPDYKSPINRNPVAEEPEISNSLKRGFLREHVESENDENPNNPSLLPEKPVVCARCHSLRHYGKVKDSTVENLLPDFDFDHTVGRKLNSGPNPFGNAFVGAGSGLIRGGLGAYGEKILGSSSEYVQSNISRYFSDPQYYFQVNDHYVRNKLKVVLFPFLHRGHWTRITEPVGGRLSYKPPIYDINAPDLYIPFMAFGTYVVLAGFSLGLHGKFSPEALNWLFIKGLVGWFLQVSLLKMSLFSLGSGEAPLLDIVAYAGYTFTGMCLAVLGRIMWSYSYYFLMPWACLCMGIFLVKTMKRVLFAEVRTYDSSRHHYLLLFIALAQFPLLIWLGNISVNWLF